MTKQLSFTEGLAQLRAKEKDISLEDFLAKDNITENNAWKLGTLSQN